MWYYFSITQILEDDFIKRQPRKNNTFPAQLV